MAKFAATAYNYHTIFVDICLRRFQKLTRFVFLVTYFVSVLLGLVGGYSWLQILLPLRASPLFLGFFLVLCLRKQHTHVNYLGYKTLFSQLVGELLSTKFVQSVTFYALSSLIYFLGLSFQIGDLSFKSLPRMHHFPPINDKFVFYYYNAVLLSVLYALQFSVFDRNRLSFKFGVFHTHPKASLINKLPAILVNSVVLSFLINTVSPIIYLFCRHYLYDAILLLSWMFSLNKTHPLLSVNFKIWLQISIYNFILLTLWELFDSAFNAFLSIGCLHKGHTLSELSPDPYSTLLSGLKSDKPFTKLTAFQELAFISNSSDPKRRIEIYNKNNKREFLWGEILKECGKVINENNLKITQVLIEYSKIEQPPSLASNTTEPDLKNDRSDEILFGKEYKYEKFNSKDQFKLNDYNRNRTELVRNETINKIITELNNAQNLVKYYYYNFIKSGFGVPFRKTLKRETESICPVPGIIGNAIISIAFFATNSFDEDKRGGVPSTISDILELLEKSVSTCGFFLQNLPSFLNEISDDNLISVIHELSMNGFFEVVLKYNEVLNDILLPRDVQKLVDWTLETASRDADDDE